MMGVPTFYTRLLADPRLDRALVAHIRLFVSGSAPLLAETHVEFEARTGHRILERYGMTETNMNTSNPYDGERRAGTVGLPLPGVELRIADPRRARRSQTARSASSKCAAATSSRAIGTCRRKPGRNSAPDGFFITGDLGQVDADGYVTIVGRAKDLVISGGYNIYPKEVEMLLDERARRAGIGGHRRAASAISAKASSRSSRRRPGAVLDEAALLAGIGDRLARFKQPRRIFIVDELPRNTMGKVQKNLLRERYRDVFKT